MTFVKRRIDVTISLAEGQFGETQGPDVTLSGLRAKASIVTYNGDAQGQMQLRVNGLPLSMINQLTTVGPIMQQRRDNRILVAAGNDGGAMSTVYQGTFASAFGEFQSAPDVAFNITALSASLQAVKPVNAISFRGPTDAATVIQGIAQTMGFAFENNGVTAQLSSPYFSGTAYEQLKSCARAANIYFTVDRGTVAIWPKTAARTGDPIPISPATGMVGYPVFSGNGIGLTTEFNPDLKLGGQVNVNSSITVANGIWNVFSIVHELESEMPGGAWFSHIGCYKLGI
jgi:hypothetical protein